MFTTLDTTVMVHVYTYKHVCTCHVIHVGTCTYNTIYLVLMNSMALSMFSTVTNGSKGPNISSCIILSSGVISLSSVGDMYREDSS